MPLSACAVTGVLYCIMMMTQTFRFFTPRALFLALLVAGFWSCSRRPPPNPADLWPELIALDVAAERAEHRIHAGVDQEELIELADQLDFFTLRLLASKPPIEMPQPERVRTRLDDLSRLRDDLLRTQPPEPNLMLGFHPIAADLLQAAGIPHIHHHGN